ncbi:MAG: DUF2218 domain-containing protein [Anaerolineae bacterium]
MESTTKIQTEKAPRYMKALVNHFSRKADAAYEGDSGYIEFAFGRCEIQTDAETLSFTLNSPGQEELDRLKVVVDKHLARFSQNEIAGLEWQAQ